MDVRLLDAALQPHRREDDQLRLGIVTIDVGRRVGLGKPTLLRFGQGVVKSKTRRLHPVQDVIACAIEDAGNTKQPIARKPFLYGADYGKTPGNRRLVQELPILHTRQIQEFGTMLGNQLLVRGHDRLAGTERPPNQISRGLQPTHQLDDHVHIGRQHIVEVLGPPHRRRQPINTFALDISVTNTRQPQHTIRPCSQNLRNRATHRAKAHNGDARRKDRRITSRRD